MKINIAELLKDCPFGMELDCTMYDNVTLVRVDDGDDYPIKINTKSGFSTRLTKYGQNVNIEDAKCVIFPKGETTWEGFHRPFKDGDILTNERGSICIYKGPMYYNKNLADFYCGYRISDHAFIFKKFKDKHFGDVNELRFATEKEKQKLFDVIKAKGYHWNAKAKTLDKIEPKFKVGDIVQSKITSIIGTINLIINDKHEYQVTLKKGGIIYILFEYQDNWKLVPNKFDINTLVPFESRVLMRPSNAREWVATFYSHYSNNKFYGCGMCCDQCIPYEGNEHLCGTTNNCDEFYKTW